MPWPLTIASTTVFHHTSKSMQPFGNSSLILRILRQWHQSRECTKIGLEGKITASISFTFANVVQTYKLPKFADQKLADLYICKVVLENLVFVFFTF